MVDSNGKLFMSATVGKRCITGSSYPMSGRQTEPTSPPYCLSFELFCVLLLDINGTWPTPIGELIADRADGKIGLNKMFGTFLSCKGNIEEKGCPSHFLRAATKIKASFYDSGVWGTITQLQSMHCLHTSLVLSSITQPVSWACYMLEAHTLPVQPAPCISTQKSEASKIEGENS